MRRVPPLAERLAMGRPVLDMEHLKQLTARILDMTTAPSASVRVTHTVRVTTRIANGRILSADDGDFITLRLTTADDPSLAGVFTAFETNQLDEPVLRAAVAHCERIMRETRHPKEPAYPVQRQVPEVLLPVQLWHDETAQAMADLHTSTVLPDLLGTVARAGLLASGFVGLMAQSEAVVTKDGISAFYEETDSEVTVTARGEDGKSSGWGGQAARKWTDIKPAQITAHAIELAQRSANPVALEPGRRTAILSPAAVAQLVRHLGTQFDAYSTDQGHTALWTPSRRLGGKLGQRVLDPRLTLSSDPRDPDGGYCPYFDQGYAAPALTLVDRGILTNLAYTVIYANERGKRPYTDDYTQNPVSLRLSGGDTALEEMIAQCKEGIYVNRFSNTDPVYPPSGLLTGVTRDGCFLIKDGKLSKAIKNFRFLDSPFFAFNNVDAIGPTARVALGYAPSRMYHNWPLPPIIVPPMMIRDFNFNRTSDAV